MAPPTPLREGLRNAFEGGANRVRGAETGCSTHPNEERDRATCEVELDGLVQCDAEIGGEFDAFHMGGGLG